MAEESRRRDADADDIQSSIAFLQMLKECMQKGTVGVILSTNAEYREHFNEVCVATFDRIIRLLQE